MKVTRVALIFGLLLFAAAAVSAQQAAFQQVNGKVEVRPVGGSWSAAQVGTTIPMNATISTGFGAEAVVAIGESSVRVDPLTRLTLEVLAEREGVRSSRFSLNVGRVEANVQSAEGLSNDFRVQSARSTASVRGTIYTYDGFTIEVTEGAVSLANSHGQQRTVFQNQGSTTNGEDYPEPGEWWAENAVSVFPETAGLPGVPIGGAGGPSSTGPFANIVVEF